MLFSIAKQELEREKLWPRLTQKLMMRKRTMRTALVTKRLLPKRGRERFMVSFNFVILLVDNGYLQV